MKQEQVFGVTESLIPQLLMMDVMDEIGVLQNLAWRGSRIVIHPEGGIERVGGWFSQLEGNHIEFLSLDPVELAPGSRCLVQVQGERNTATFVAYMTGKPSSQSHHLGELGAVNVWQFRMLATSQLMLTSPRRAYRRALMGMAVHFEGSSMPIYAATHDVSGRGIGLILPRELDRRDHSLRLYTEKSYIQFQGIVRHQQPTASGVHRVGMSLAAADRISLKLWENLLKDRRELITPSTKANRKPEPHTDVKCQCARCRAGAAAA
ncbi:MAG: hypothetical protein JSS72_08000 [Armatimonadetes bacterium]|nr:hypothetical protein [Armatimonadota bacterium]